MAQPSELEPLPDLDPGVFRHFKGGLYLLLGVERDSETLEPRVRYRHLPDQEMGPLDSEVWSRPYASWTEEVAWPDGVKRPRFVRTAT